MNSNQVYYSSSKRNRSNKINFLEKVILFLIASLLLQLILPWWSILIAGFFVALFTSHLKGNSFIAAFVAVFLVWTTYALWLDIHNNHILSHRIIKLFPLPEHSVILVLITGIVGGLAIGFAAMAGNQTGMVIFHKKRKIV